MDNEQAGYFKAADGSPLYAVYHPAPPGVSAPVVIVPPLFEERKSAYGCLRRLAARLAGAGHPVLRFDYRGSGESGGSSAHRRWQHLGEDLSSARQLLVQLCGRGGCALLGLRLGGTLALQEVFHGQAAAVAALAPVINGAAQVRQWKMRSKIRTELTDEGGRDARGTIDFDGYLVAPEFFDDLSAIDLLKDSRPLPCRGGLIQLSHRTEAAVENQQLLAKLGSNARLEVLRMEPFWDKMDAVDTQPLEDLVLALSSWLLTADSQVPSRDR